MNPRVLAEGRRCVASCRALAEQARNLGCLPEADLALLMTTLGDLGAAIDREEREPGTLDRKHFEDMTQACMHRLAAQLTNRAAAPPTPN